MPTVLRTFNSPARWRIWMPMLSFAARNWLASTLALYVAFCLQLESPFWAWVTVWIVAQPTPGMVLSKGIYRFYGTCGGAFLAVLLIRCFAQTPELFVLGLGAVMGVSTMASNLLRNFRAYATVLAAYTSGIVAADAISQPDQIFLIAVSRVSAISVGIVSCIVVTTIFAPHRAAREVRAKLQKEIGEACDRAVLRWQAPEIERITLGSKLISRLISLDTQIEFAAAESAEFRLQANNARSVLANLLGMISARRALDEHLRRRGWPENLEVRTVYGDVIDLLSDVRSRLQSGHLTDLIAEAQMVQNQLLAVNPEESVLVMRDLASQRYVLDRLDELVVRFRAAIEDWKDLVDGVWEHEPRLVLNFHRDQRAAVINGLRAFLATVATGFFWIFTAWPDGPSALVFVSILITLFSSNPNPERVGWTFLKTGSFALFVALICKYYILTWDSTFEYLAITMAFILIPMGIVMAHPKTSFFATSFSLVFLNLVQPTNPAVYNLASTLNTGMAMLIGVLFGTLSFQMIFPPDPRAARLYVTHRIRLGLQKLVTFHQIPSPNDWETRMYDRVYRLYDPTNPSATSTDEWLLAGFGALIMGLEILRLRRLESGGELPREIHLPVEFVVKSFERFSQNPSYAEDEVKRQVQVLSAREVEVGDPNRKTWARVMSSVAEIHDFLVHNPELLKR